MSITIFLQYTDREVRLEHWNTFNSAFFSSRVTLRTLEYLKGPTPSQELFFINKPMLPKNLQEL